MHRAVPTLAAAVAVALLSAPGIAADAGGADPSAAGAAIHEEVSRDDLGRTVKYRILVDKVMQPTRGWGTEEWMVEEAARAGFNVFVPRQGYERLDEVRQVADWCRERGIFFMPWMRGTRTAKGPEADGQRFVWADGTEEPFWSPNADPLWKWLNQYIVQYAKIAARNPHLVGVFLDYENYSPSRKPNCYDLSYDAGILAAFAKSRNLALPDLPPARRKPWLDEQGLHTAFEQFQVDHWRRRCRSLRQAVDQHDPGFRFCVYPAPGTPFMVRAIYPEWATAKAPLVLADACTYGNRTGALVLADSLEANRRTLLERRKIPEAAGIPFFYTGGIDPAVEGADPEFSGKNADLISRATDGYWVFYEGPKYDYAGPDPYKDHRAYFHWFERANRDIAAGTFALWKEPRQTPDPLVQAVRDTLAAFGRAGVGPYNAPAVPAGGKEPAFTVRGKHTFVVLVRKGETLRGRLGVQRLGRYESGCAYVVLAPDGTQIAAGQAALGQSAEVRGPADRPGLYAVVLDTGSNAAQLTVANASACLLGPRMGLIRAQPRAYLMPMPGATRLKIALESPSPGETAEIVLRDGDGHEVARADTVTEKRVTVAAQVPEALRGRPWSIDLGRASKGSCEDFTVEILRGAAPLLATHPSRLLKLEKPLPE